MVFSYKPTSDEIPRNLDDAEIYVLLYYILYIANFSILINGLVHEILVLMAYVGKPPVKAHTDMSSITNGLFWFEATSTVP